MTNTVFPRQRPLEQATETEAQAPHRTFRSTYAPIRARPAPCYTQRPTMTACSTRTTTHSTGVVTQPSANFILPVYSFTIHLHFVRSCPSRFAMPSTLCAEILRGTVFLRRHNFGLSGKTKLLAYASTTRCYFPLGYTAPLHLGSCSLAIFINNLLHSGGVDDPIWGG